MMSRFALLLVVVVVAATCLRGGVDASTVEAFPRSGSPVCISAPTGGLPFCTMVDYDVAAAAGTNLAAEDATAETKFAAIDVVLHRFDCSNRYSAHNCSSCRDAYRYWVCGMTFPACSDTGGAATCTFGEDCPTAGNHKRMCRSICEDVVRKCPYVANFKCPTEDTIEYSGDIETCNKLGRSVWPPGSDSAWPGTFNAAIRAPHPTVWLAVLCACLMALVQV